jgi:hypothetical protein
MYNGKECSSEVKFNMKSGISADIILQTPWMDDITVSFLHKGQILSFTSKLDADVENFLKSPNVLCLANISCCLDPL